MRCLAVLAVVLTVAGCSLEAEWAMFKHYYGKNYDKSEEPYRRSVFQANLEKIDDHNDRFAMGEFTYYLSIDQFADMTKEEFKSRTKCLKLPNSFPAEQTKDEVVVNVDDLPSSVDWRKKDVVTAVGNENGCGSCWAFSAAGAVEGAHAIATGKLVNLSISNLIDCDKACYGCGGGLTSQAFEYIISHKGIDTAEAYPYVPKDGDCKFSTKSIGATISSYVNITSGSEAALQEAVAKYGPVSVGVNSVGFLHYKGGILDIKDCWKTRDFLDHAALVVGYGTEYGVDFWLVKNSWGAEWGEEGYIRMSRNKDNQCGIATLANYPVV